MLSAKPPNTGVTVSVFVLLCESHTTTQTHTDQSRRRPTTPVFCETKSLFLLAVTRTQIVSLSVQFSDKKVLRTCFTFEAEVVSALLLLQSVS